MKGLCNTVASTLNDETKHTFYLKWHDKGILPSSIHAHADYLENFQIVVSTHLMSLIEQQLTQVTCVTNCHDEKRSLYDDLLTHLYHCSKCIAQCYMPRGIEDIEDRMKQALVVGEKDEHQAMLVHGPDGSGKSALVSRLAQAAVQLLGKNTCMLVRYVGLTPSSYATFDLLRSVCIQLNHVLKQDACMGSYTSIEELVACYHNLLNLASKLAQSLLIVIDGVDHLKPFYQDLHSKLHWLWIRLPPKVHLVVTVTSGTNGSVSVFTKLKENLPASDFSFEIGPLDDTNIQHVVNDALTRHKRQLNPGQNTALCNTIRQNAVPLFAILLLNESLQWNSDLELTCGGDLPSTIDAIINATFVALEGTFGKKVISHLTRYLSSAHHGLSEMELLDLLSCNNDIMLEVLTPTQLQSGMMRFPVYIWLHIKKMLGEFS